MTAALDIMANRATPTPQQSVLPEVGRPSSASMRRRGLAVAK